jgi:hypothetical protein
MENHVFSPGQDWDPDKSWDEPINQWFCPMIPMKYGEMGEFLQILRMSLPNWKNMPQPRQNNWASMLSMLSMWFTERSDSHLGMANVCCLIPHSCRQTKPSVASYHLSFQPDLARVAALPIYPRLLLVHPHVLLNILIYNISVLFPFALGSHPQLFWLILLSMRQIRKFHQEILEALLFASNSR